MILLNINYPSKCSECKLYKCGGCVAVDNRKVSDDIWDQGKPDWCPILAEFHEKKFLNDMDDALLYGIRRYKDDN